MQWQPLQRALERMAQSNDATLGELTPFGQKYEVRSDLDMPSGRSLRLVTAWIVRQGEGFPRLITAYPEET